MLLIGLLKGEATFMSQTYARGRAFRLTAFIVLVLLVLQYILGMIANLEVQFPNGFQTDSKRKCLELGLRA